MNTYSLWRSQGQSHISSHDSVIHEHTMFPMYCIIYTMDIQGTENRVHNHNTETS